MALKSSCGYSRRYCCRARTNSKSIGFSIIAGVDPSVGLYASVAIAIVISFTGGRPAMISAATAAVALLVVPSVRDHGVQYLFAATILMGAIQIIAGLLRLDLIAQHRFAKGVGPAP